LKDKIKYFGIEALPIHKEICGYLIDNDITFHCYNGGLKMIQIEKVQPLAKGDFIGAIADIFNLVENRRGKDTIYYKSK
jgi:hypothetical protein